MRVSILTLFPDAVKAYVDTSILGRAQKSKKLSVGVFHIRDFARDKHHITDDRPFGGGPGMVMKAEPILRAVNAATKKAKNIVPKDTLVILTDATGKIFTQTEAKAWPKKFKHIIFICGHYEGIDARVVKILHSTFHNLQSVSIGNFVLTGGELPALVMFDALARHIAGVLGKEESLEEARNSLGVPTYTRPPEVMWPEKGGKKYNVPTVLQSGNHAKIDEWRKKNQKLNLKPQK